MYVSCMVIDVCYCRIIVIAFSAYESLAPQLSKLSRIPNHPDNQRTRASSAYAPRRDAVHGSQSLFDAPAGDVRRVSTTLQSALQNALKKIQNAYGVYVLVNHLKTLGNNIVTLVVVHPHGTRVRTLLSAHVVPTDIHT